jgi:nucleoside-diphosphate kinase
MRGNKTLTMIKPVAFSKNYTGQILAKIIESGFRISAMKLTKLTLEQSQQFYAVHKERPFYNDLVEFMSSGPIVAAILEKDNAVEEYRKVIGATNPENAEAGTIRALFGTSLQANAVHGSDSDENAEIESNFFFSGCERYRVG